MEEGISIIVTAYHASKYIKEALDSMQNQTWFKTHDNYEILLGIDHCEETRKVVEEIMYNYKNLTVVYMDKNYGTYVTSNTLISFSKYNWVLRFDSDDIMLPTMIKQCFEFVDKNPEADILRFHFRTFSDNPKESKSTDLISHGQLFINKKILIKYGCFLPWICSADGELLTRVKKKAKIKVVEKETFLRRRHPDSLVADPKTNMKSKIRKDCIEFIRTVTPNNPIIKTYIGDYDILKGEAKMSDLIYGFGVEMYEEGAGDVKPKNKVKPVSKKIYLKAQSMTYWGI